MELQIGGGREFINRLTTGKLNDRQMNRCLAYLRAKGILFYDNWSQDHCLFTHSLLLQKEIVLNALQEGLKA